MATEQYRIKSLGGIVRVEDKLPQPTFMFALLDEEPEDVPEGDRIKRVIKYVRTDKLSESLRHQISAEVQGITVEEYKKQLEEYIKKSNDGLSTERSK